MADNIYPDKQPGRFSLLLTPARRRAVAVAIVIAILLSLLITAMTDASHSSMIFMGDFPGFYVLAIIKANHDISQLYNPDLQRTIENFYWPQLQGQFYMSVYPPYDAYLLYPLSFLSPMSAQILFTTAAFGSFVGACKLVAKINPSFDDDFFSNSVFTFLICPVMTAILAAQNTSFSMLLFALIIFHLKDGT